MLPNMKNIQILDGALNDANFVYQATSEEFEFVFSGNCDVEFADSVWERQQIFDKTDLWPKIWSRPVLKSEIDGIHGSLYLSYFNRLQECFPTKRYVDYRCDVSSLPLRQMLLKMKEEKSIDNLAEYPKNVQVSDAGGSGLFFVYQVSEVEFKLLFPAPGQDIEFEEDVVDRLNSFNFDRFFSHPMPKSQAAGIHGTFFAKGQLARKQYFKNKRERDIAEWVIAEPIKRLYNL